MMTMVMHKGKDRSMDMFVLYILFLAWRTYLGDVGLEQGLLLQQTMLQTQGMQE